MYIGQESPLKFLDIIWNGLRGDLHSEIALIMTVLSVHTSDQYFTLSTIFTINQSLTNNRRRKTVYQ